ncbi:Protein NRT1/ PTR FAMILY 2.13 [Linum perenne]
MSAAGNTLCPSEHQLGSPPTSAGTPKLPENDDGDGKKQPGGWRAMPYVLGNETCERLATVGLFANFQVYLTREFHMEQAKAAQLLNVWSGFTNFMPLVGAFICDAYMGRFKTIAFSIFAELLGMVTVTLIACLPQLQPPKCDVASKQNGLACIGPTTGQLGVLLTGMGLLSVGAGGIRPCSIPFGVDQFDARTEKGVKGINSFFNWTRSVGPLGSGSPPLSWWWRSSCSLQGGGSMFMSSLKGACFQGSLTCFTLLYKKRKLKLDDDGNIDGRFYDPPTKSMVIHKLPLTSQLRFLNKAAFIESHDEVNHDGQPSNPRSLVSIQKVEEVKCLLKVIPVWSAGIISLIAIAQQDTFTVSQALVMNRHVGTKFQIPAGTMSVISSLIIALWLPFYDQILIPRLRRITKYETGITLLQRVGIGMVFSILSMIVAGLVEKDRRDFANAHPHEPPVSVMWLVPQLAIMGMCQAFLFLGQIEFLNKEFPENMRSMANALFSVSIAIANYLSSVLITVVRKSTTGRDGRRPDWLANDLNQGRLDLFYFVLAGMGFVNFFYSVR